MDSDIHYLEESLAKLTPQPLSEDLLGRLDSAMSQALPAEADDELSQILAGLEPSPISSDLIARMDHAMANWHESVPVEEKVIEMTYEGRPSRSNHFLGWKSAAAVAVLGAAMAFITGGGGQSPDEMLISTKSVSPVNPVSFESPSRRSDVSSNIQPASYSSAFEQHDASADLVGATERGFVWTPDGRLLLRMEVEVNSRMNFRNELGEELVIKKPRRQVILKPIKVD